jgi:hypothetical protein
VVKSRGGMRAPLAVLLADLLCKDTAAPTGSSLTASARPASPHHEELDPRCASS